MAKKDYIPRKISELVIWLTNYRAKLTTHKAALGISDTDYNTQIAFIDALTVAINAQESAANSAEAATETMQTQRTLSLNGIRAKAQNIKTLTTYTTAIGDDLRIIGDESVIDIDNATPVLTPKKLVDGWRFSFNLLGFFTAVKIFGKRPGEAKLFLAIDTSSPYIDTEPMVNGTMYTAAYMIGDEVVGIESAAITISI